VSASLASRSDTMVYRIIPLMIGAESIQYHQAFAVTLVSAGILVCRNAHHDFRELHHDESTLYHKVIAIRLVSAVIVAG
jgi:hypothetical protein